MGDRLRASGAPYGAITQASVSNITSTTVIAVAVSAVKRTLNLIFPRCSERAM